MGGTLYVLKESDWKFTGELEDCGLRRAILLSIPVIILFYDEELGADWGKAETAKNIEQTQSLIQQINNSDIIKFKKEKLDDLNNRLALLKNTDNLEYSYKCLEYRSWFKKNAELVEL